MNWRREARAGFLLMLMLPALSRCWADDAAIVAVVAGGGKVISDRFGFSVIDSEGRETKAVKDSRGGYWVSGPKVNARLNPPGLATTFLPFAPSSDATARA
jgi:hypothetical protein